MNVKLLAAKAGMKAKDIAPSALVIGGVIGVGVATGMIIKAANKNPNIIKTGKDEIEQTRSCDGTPEQIEKSVKKTRKDTAKMLLKTYGPGIGLEIASISCILYGHKLVTGRLAAITTAYGALHQSYSRIVRRLDEVVSEEDKGKIKEGIYQNEVEVPEVDKDGNETGKTKTEKVSITMPDEVSCYAKCFEAGSRYFHKDPTLNLLFLKNKEEEMTRLLHKRGYVTLNEVYCELDIPIVPYYGTNVGWVLNNGENKVSFDIYNIHKEANRDFVNGYEPCIWLDFNVDSVDISKDLKRVSV